jgi:cell division protein FtsL
MIGFSAILFAGALLFVAAGQAIVVSQQLRLDNAQQELSTATATNTNLQIERASLDSPTRILQLAQHKLGMITPANVVYLVPIKVGPTVGSLKNSVQP